MTLGDAVRRFAKLFRRKKDRRHQRYEFHPSHTVISDYSEFSGLPISTIEDGINNWRQRCKDEWNALPQGDFVQKSAAFYASSKSYIFDLLGVNLSLQVVREKLNSFTPQIIELIASHPGKTLLEFGGGAGVFCELAQNLGKAPTYLDVPGVPMEFAGWRFRKYGISMRMIEAKPGIFALDGVYDIVFSDAVIEHLVPGDQEMATSAMCDAVGSSGLLIYLVDLCDDYESYPMHAKVEIRALHGQIAMRGFENVFGRDRFCSIWRRREGTSAR